MYRLNQDTEKDYSYEKLLEAITPEFQRQNTKWSEPMQVKFVENILAGYKTTFLFYSTEDGGGHLENCFLLDGLQRMTAIKDFQEGKFPVFGRFYFDDINHRSVFRNSHITAQFFHFEDDLAACEHYIAMNEGITHSPEDIEIAYNFIAERN